VRANEQDSRAIIEHAFVHVFLVPELPATTTKQKGKKKDPAPAGSVKIEFDCTYKAFKTRIANVVKFPEDAVLWDHLTWKFCKPKGATAMPLACEDGFLACLAQVQDATSRTAQVIHVFVPETRAVSDFHLLYYE
jgi:hypothetical protein